MKYRIYASVLLEVDVLDSTTETEAVKRTVKKRLELQLNGQRAMELKDIGTLLIISGGD